MSNIWQPDTHTLLSTSGHLLCPHLTEWGRKFGFHVNGDRDIKTVCRITNQDQIKQLLKPLVTFAPKNEVIHVQLLDIVMTWKSKYTENFTMKKSKMKSAAAQLKLSWTSRVCVNHSNNMIGSRFLGQLLIGYLGARAGQAPSSLKDFCWGLFLMSLEEPNASVSSVQLCRGTRENAGSALAAQIGWMHPHKTECESAKLIKAE